MSRMTVDLAASIASDLWRRGRTVPATAQIIAASAIRARAELLHVDDHFDEIAGVSALASRNLAKPA
jgi:predicted nucleic acid-binding protein